MYHSIKRDELFDVILLVISLFSFCLSCFPVYCNVHILVFTEKKKSVKLMLPLEKTVV